MKEIVQDFWCDEATCSHRFIEPTSDMISTECQSDSLENKLNKLREMEEENDRLKIEVDRLKTDNEQLRQKIVEKREGACDTDVIDAGLFRRELRSVLCISMF